MNRHKNTVRIYFNPLPPCGGRQFRLESAGCCRNFNPLPPCGGRLSCMDTPSFAKLISIHSLRVEGDVSVVVSVAMSDRFQSTPSVWRETNEYSHLSLPCSVFQSTPSVWRETQAATTLLMAIVFQSTPSVWRETGQRRSGQAGSIFQSTPSVWRETSCVDSLKSANDISIHSLRVEGDLFDAPMDLTVRRFQSTPSVWRETPSNSPSASITFPFQSTPSVWRETIRAGQRHVHSGFQSTPSVWRETRLDKVLRS